MTVHLDSVSRRFGSVVALERATIDAPAGSITVLLGPNGAGKTTAIRLITGAITADSGSVTVFGADPTGADGEMVRRRCGVVTAKPSLYDRLSGFDNLRYAAELFGLGRGPAADARITESAEIFGIAESLGHEVGGYSTGMKTRLALARSVLHEPDLLLLDEPTSGLDPESAAAVLKLIRTMTSGGQTVVMCTHLLLEAEGLADSIVVMEAGTTVTWGRPEVLALDFWPRPIVDLSAVDPGGLDRLARHRHVADYQREGETARLTLDSPTTGAFDQVADIVADLVNDGVRVTAVEPWKPTLEDLYFAIMARYEQPPPPDSGAPAIVGADSNGRRAVVEASR